MFTWVALSNITIRLNKMFIFGSKNFHLVRRDYSGMLIVFPIVQHLKDEQPIAHNKALKFCSDDNRKVLQAIIHDMESAGAVTLEHFIETIESESPSKENLPRDGTVHEMASNAFLFLEQLQAHSGVGGGMIAAKENDGISSPAQCKRAFSNYILRVLKAMKNNLQAKAKLYEESKALRALFLMNNFNFIIQRNLIMQNPGLSLDIGGTSLDYWGLLDQNSYEL